MTPESRFKIMLKCAGYRKAVEEALSPSPKTIAAAGLAGGLASKANQSLKDPDGRLHKLRNRYLRSRYLPGGYLKRTADSLDAIRMAIYRRTSAPPLSDRYY